MFKKVSTAGFEPAKKLFPSQSEGESSVVSFERPYFIVVILPFPASATGGYLHLPTCLFKLSHHIVSKLLSLWILSGQSSTHSSPSWPAFTSLIVWFSTRPPLFSVYKPREIADTVLSPCGLREEIGCRLGGATDAFEVLVWVTSSLSLGRPANWFRHRLLSLRTRRRTQRLWVRYLRHHLPKARLL